MHYQCVILWNDAEIGFGEGESAEGAKQEAEESVPAIYHAARSEWVYEGGSDAEAQERDSQARDVPYLESAAPFFG